MRRFFEKVMDAFGDFSKVHRAAMTLQRKVREIASVLDAYVRTLRAAPFAQGFLPRRFESPSQRSSVSRSWFFHAALFEIFRKLIEEFFFRQKRHRLYRLVQFQECAFDCLRKRLVHVPTALEIRVFAAIAEMMANIEKKKDVVAFLVVLRDFREDGYFGKDASVRLNSLFQLFKRLRVACVGAGIAQDAMPLDSIWRIRSRVMPYSFADGFKCTTLPARNEAKTIRQDAASTIGETREEFLSLRFSRQMTGNVRVSFYRCLVCLRS